VVLQFNEVVPALKDGRLDGVVTNWGTAIPGATDWLHVHTDVPFYSSAFFIVMNQARYDALPPDVRTVLDAMSGPALVDRFAALWGVWDKPMLDAAHGSGQEIIEPDATTRAAWREGLRPVSDQVLTELQGRGFRDAGDAYDGLMAVR